jgi:2-oxoglutarate dehydrogenase E2 component (dihydrolipoamide succinyltransferase)
MSIDLKIPAVGESITEVQIGEWLKAEGDVVKQDEPLAIIDSEKSTLELPAPQNGRLTKILHQAGETVTVGAVVAQMEPDGVASKPREEMAAQPAPPAPKVETPKPKEKAVASPSAKAPDKVAPAPSEREAKPAAAKVPESGKVPPSPPESAVPAGREEQVVPMTMLRRTAARRLVEAQQAMAMLTTFNEVDMSAVQAMRHEYQEAFEKRYQVKLGFMSFFIKAAVDALRQFPQLNAEIRGNDIVYRNYFDIGVAVSTERGLVVPVLREAQHLSFAEIEKAVADFAWRAREGQLKPDELSGGTFTITNGGVFGSLLSTPIINPPQTGILGLHTIQDRPVALQGQVVIRPMMYVALTYDHRLVDGREAVLFLRRIKQAIEAPARLLVEI